MWWSSGIEQRECMFPYMQLIGYISLMIKKHFFDLLHLKSYNPFSVSLHIAVLSAACSHDSGNCKTRASRNAVGPTQFSQLHHHGKRQGCKEGRWSNRSEIGTTLVERTRYCAFRTPPFLIAEERIFFASFLSIGVNFDKRFILPARETTTCTA